MVTIDSLILHGFDSLRSMGYLMFGRASSCSSIGVVSILHGFSWLSRCAYLLVDEHGNDEDCDKEDDDEDDDDTGFALSPVLLALHQLVGSVVAAADELVHVDGGHCEGWLLQRW
jgi:hypothetical protein